MLRSNLLLVLVAVLLVSGLFVGCAPGGPTAEKPIVWRFNGTIGVPPVIYAQDNEWPVMAEMIRTGTDGRLDVELHYASSLGFKGPELLSVVGDGLVEMSEIWWSWVAVQEKFFEITDFYRLTKNIDETQAVMTALRPMVEEVCDEWDVVLWAYYNKCGFQSVWFLNKEINSVQDLQGIKVRTYGPILAKAIMEPAGLTPVFMSWADAVPALKTGVVDGINTGLDSGHAAGITELVKYAYNVTPWGAIIPCAVIISKQHLEALPKDLQDQVMNIGKRFEDRLWQVGRAPEKFGYYSYDAVLKMINEAGCEVLDLPPDAYEAIDTGMMKELDAWIAAGDDRQKEAAAIVLDTLKQVRGG